MELLKGGKGQMAPPRNLALKQLECECGCNTFIVYPIAVVAYNALNPTQVEPQVFGNEMQCKNCGKFQCQNHEPGQLPKWVSRTREEKEAIDQAAFKANQEKAKA